MIPMIFTPFVKKAFLVIEAQVSTRNWVHHACSRLTQLEYHAINVVLPFIQQNRYVKDTQFEDACIGRHLDVYDEMQEWAVICDSL